MQTFFFFFKKGFENECFTNKIKYKKKLLKKSEKILREILYSNLKTKYHKEIVKKKED